MERSIEIDRFRLAQAFSISRGSKEVVEVLTVRLKVGQHSGWGECVPYARYDETPASVSKQIAGLPQQFTLESLQTLLPPGAARNAVDCALWDLRCKQQGKRIWELLGITKPQAFTTAYTISLDKPESMEQMANKHAHRPLLKIKLGTAEDLPRLEAVRRGAPNAGLIVDANEGWTAATYSDLAPHLLRLGVQLVEQPLPASEDKLLAEIERPVPVCADESCFDRASLPNLKGKYDFVNIKLDKTGGLSEALALRKAAEEQGFGIMIGCMVASSLAIAPATVLTPGAAITDLDAPLLLAEDRAEPLFFDEQGLHAPTAGLWG